MSKTAHVFFGTPKHTCKIYIIQIYLSPSMKFFTNKYYHPIPIWVVFKLQNALEQNKKSERH